MFSKRKKRLLFVGAGLSTCLSVFLLKNKYPHLDIIIVEKSNGTDKHKTWSFHSTDISKKYIKILSPLIFKKWPGHNLFFPNYTREVATSYYTMRSDHVHKELKKLIGEKSFKTNVEIEKINFPEVIFSTGEIEKFDYIFEATGMDEKINSPCGYQKFLGLDIEFIHPHNLLKPILMDARVEQKDGYRFLYVLPLDEKKLLVEDTRYSNTSFIDEDEFIKSVLSYAEANWGPIKEVLGTEKASLPIPLLQRKNFLTKDYSFPIGVKAGLFHPTTGYSFPYAVRTAEFILKNFKKHPSLFARKYRQFLSEERKRSKFYFTLNRMLFGAAEDHQRINIFEHFYRLPADIVGRFYSGRSTKFDMLRILSGKPPVSISRAVKSLISKRWMNSFKDGE